MHKLLYSLLVLMMLFIPVVVIAYSCCSTGWEVNRSKYRRTASSRRYANFIDSVSISRWGVFDEVQVNLTGRPVFIAITGETGSGKSNFIAALQYISGLNIYNNKLKQFNSNSSGSNCDNKEIQIAMNLVSDLHPSSPMDSISSNTVKRVYSLTTKKSVCEINEKKVLMKSLSVYLSSCIRFWSTSSIRKLDTNEFIYYVDLNLGQRSVQLLSYTAAVFDDWSQSHRELLYLKDMQLRIIENDELRLVEQQLGELSALQHRTALLVAALRDFFDRDRDQHHATSGVTRASYLEIVELLESCTSEVARDDLDLTRAWQAIMLSEVFLKRLTKSLSDWLGSSTEPQKKGPVPTGRVMEVGSGSDHLQSKVSSTGYSILMTMAEQLDDYSNDVLKLKRSLTSIGVLNNDLLLRDIEELYSSVQTSMDSLQAASQIGGRISRQLPDLSSLLEQLIRLRSEWELFARKHSRKPSELQSLKKRWRDEISAMNNLSVALPTQQSRESELRKQYVSLAFQLSAHRYQSAQSIVSKVNTMLPKLDMPDKKIAIKFDSAVSFEHLTSTVDAFDHHGGQHLAAAYVNVVPGGRVSQSGWDSLHLTVDDSLDDEAPHDTKAGLNCSCGIIYQQYLDPSGTNADYEEHDSGVRGNNDVFVSDIGEGTMIVSPSSTGISNELSSGECARLALALETISCGDRDESPSGEYDSGRGPSEKELSPRMESCLVFDEIDAHIGGEAAVSVAKLLKQQGRFRQIIAVTHNPVIAAAADLHIAVVKKQAASRTHPVGASTSSAISTICTLANRSDRESELARMATGSLNTSAGVDLAKALLDIDFSSL